MTARFFTIGLTGPAGCGKDTAAELLHVHCGAHALAFADALRAEIVEAYCIEHVFLTRRDTKERPTPALALDRCLDSGFVGRLLLNQHREGKGAALDLSAPRSPRQIMQWWGTEYRRQQDPDYWVKLASSRITWLRKSQGAQCVVLTDVRFDNEAELVRRLGGHIWQIKRPGTDHSAPSHSSQVNGEQFKPDVVINNCHDIRHLQQLVLGAYGAMTWGVKSARVEIAQ